MLVACATHLKSVVARRSRRQCHSNHIHVICPILSKLLGEHGVEGKAKAKNGCATRHSLRSNKNAFGSEIEQSPTSFRLSFEPESVFIIRWTMKD
jgi:hypothetical protein